MQADKTDSDGQPLIQFRRRENILKNVEHLLGICRGITCDGELSTGEVAYLETWIAEHGALVSEHPIGRLIVERVARIARAADLPLEERHDLCASLVEILGKEDGSAGVVSVGIEHEGVIVFAQRTFLLTGKFIFGPRRLCESAITSRGGLICAGSKPTSHTNYLIVGTLGSRDWATTGAGNKIEAALSLREKGHFIQIVQETSWSAALIDCATVK